METDKPTYTYSNLDTGLLGYTLGLSQHTSFQNLLQQHVFDKYKMHNSFTSVQNITQELVKGQNQDGVITSNWDFNVLFGAGGVLSTTEDLSKFVIAHFDPNNKELALTRKPTFEVSKNLNMGLGWHILKSQNDKLLYWYNGGTGSYSSSMTINTTDKSGVVILSNLSAFHPKMEHIDKLCFELINVTDKQ